MKLREWNAHLHGLVVFRALLNDPVVAKLLDLTDRMEAGCSSYGPVCDAVAAFEAALFEYTTNWDAGRAVPDRLLGAGAAAGVGVPAPVADL